MTDEEKIICKEYLNDLDKYHSCNEYHLIMGLLDAEPYEDVVGREAVSEWLKQYGQDVLHGKYKFSLMYIWKKLMELPSVTPKQKIGEWRINSDGYYPYCSECKEEPKNREMTKYCPNCGAKMGSA